MDDVVKAIRQVLFMIALTILICALICQMLQIKPVVVLSGSMEPEIRTGSMAFIDKKDKDIKVDDVISFRTGELLVTHRVVDITEEGYKTKGDSNDTVDAGIVKKSDVEGTVIFSVPWLGYMLKTVVLPAATSVTLLYVIMKVINRGKKYD